MHEGRRGGTAIQNFPSLRDRIGAHAEIESDTGSTFEAARTSGRRQRGELSVPRRGSFCFGRTRWATHFVPPPEGSMYGAVPGQARQQNGPANLNLPLAARLRVGHIRPTELWPSG